MKYFGKISGWVAVVFLLMAAQNAFTAEKNYADSWFPQKVVIKYPLLPGAEVRSLAFCPNMLNAGTSKGILVLSGDGWKASDRLVLNETGKIVCPDAELLAATKTGLVRHSLIPSIPEKTVQTLFSGQVSAFEATQDGYLVGTPNGLYLIRDGREQHIDAIGQKQVTALAIAPNNTVWIGFTDGLSSWDGKEAIFFPNKDPVRDIAIDEKGIVYAATKKGILRYDGQAWTLIDGKHGGLPYEDVLSVAVKNGILWAGTSMGAARCDGREWQYFQGPQYLSDDRVTAVAIGPDNTAWLGTKAGVTSVMYSAMTLEEKAAFMEKLTRDRHLRYGLVSDSHLSKSGDLSTNTTFTNDNDGLWTAMYIAGECYRFAATKDPQAKKFAAESLDALMFLQTVTGMPGFVARSIARPGEPVDEVRGDHPIQWDNWTPDKQWRWKGDTSSDEIDGHYYGYSVYYDFCADESEKPAIREKVRLITDYIIEHDFYLMDVDGKRTTYGLWNFYRPWYRRFLPNRGLNSLEMLSFLKTAYHITGDEKYQRTYLDLAIKHDYAKFVVNQKLQIPGFVNHSDDELAILVYYPLLKYETDPQLLETYRKSITRSWKIEQPEKNPLFNFIYGAVMPPGTDFDLAGSIWTLERIPLDLVRWDHHNSRRADIKIKKFKGRFHERESTIPLPPDERTIMKWNGNPYQLDTGVGWQPAELLDNPGAPKTGASEEAGTFWLLPYWMGRYYGFIQ